MEVHEDGAGNVYCEVENLRVTYVPAASRSTAKNWAGKDVIRFQTYGGDDSAKLYPGPELPVSSEETVTELVSALIRVFLASRR